MARPKKVKEETSQVESTPKVRKPRAPRKPKVVVETEKVETVETVQEEKSFLKNYIVEIGLVVLASVAVLIALTH